MIGDNVRRVRQERGLSLDALADLLLREGRVPGLTATTLHQVESGARKVASYELAELVDVLDTTFAILLGREPSPAARLAARLREHSASAAPSSLTTSHHLLEIPDDAPYASPQARVGLTPNSTGDDHDQ